MLEKEVPQGDEEIEAEADDASSADQAAPTPQVKVGFPGKP
jgi:hypothetical protein